MIDTVNASQQDKARFLRVFAFIGAVTSFFMSITSYLDGYTLLSSMLVVAVGVFASPFIIKNRDHTIAILMLYTLYAIMCFLIVSGGNHGTGPLWLFIASPVTFFIRGLKRGAIDLIVLACVISTLFYYTDKLGYYSYPSHYFPTRVMLCFSILCILGAFYEYYRNKYSRELIAQLKINKKLARTDAMTGLSNRRYATECMQSRCFAEGAVFLLIDVDNFKQVNDTYGHQVGDEVLIFIANIFKKVCTDEDINSRWGGEEFLIVIPKGHELRARNVADEIHTQLANNTFKSGKHSFNVSLSIGLYQRTLVDSIDQCLNIADKRLYKAKSQGKNQTVAEPDLAKHEPA
ncbi:GGDEF domain-containing protein [Pseudoalteromonas sp. PB2-1]|uniref:GGDEF domain-containing protein n=1 Tax=Pseudoalteromonas sp. PB2-1 TaxID=2907242 RepID=UPI003867CCA2